MAVYCPLLVALEDKTCKETLCKFWITYTYKGAEQHQCVFVILAKAELSKWAEES